MSTNDPFGSVTPRRPSRPARASLATSSTSHTASGTNEGRYVSTRSGHAHRHSLSNTGLDTEKTPRKPNPGAGASPLLSDTSQTRSGSGAGDRSMSGGSRGSNSSARATVGISSRLKGPGGAGPSSSTPSSSSSHLQDRSARRSLVLSSSSTRNVSSPSPALRSAPLLDRKRAAPSGEDDSFDADTSADMSAQRDADGFDADISTRSTVLDRERRRRSAMHMQEVQVLRSESRLGSRQGYNDEDEIGERTEDQSEEDVEDSREERRRSGVFVREKGGGHKRNPSYYEDDDLVDSTVDTSFSERHKFPQRPAHTRQDTTESSGTGGGTGTDTSGTEGAGGHSRTASRNYRNGDGHTSGSSGMTTSTSGKRRRRKQSTASNHNRRDSGAMRPSTSFEERQPPSTSRGFDEFAQSHWQAVGARARRISLTQQQRSRMRSAESDATAVRESLEPIESTYRTSISSRRSPLPGGVQGHERSATLSDLDYGRDRPLSSQSATYRAVEEETYRPPDEYTSSLRREDSRRHAPRLSVSRGETREEDPGRAYTPHSAYRSSASTIRDRISRTPDPNMGTGMVGGRTRRIASGMGSVSSRGGDDLSSTVRPSLDGVFGAGGSAGLPLCDRNMQRAFDQFEAYFSFPSVAGPADTASNPGSAIRPRASSIATDAPTASAGSSRSTNGAATPSTPTSGGGHSASALADSVELVACFKAVTLMASELNSGLRRLREDVNEAHVDADVHNNPLASSLWRMGKDLAQLVKSSDTQLRNLTEGLIAFKRADRERERVRRVAAATNSENGSVAGGGTAGSNRSNSRLSSLMLAQRSPGSDSRRSGREATAARASISEYRRGGIGSTSNPGLLEGDRDRMMTSPTSLPSGRSSTASTGGANSHLNGNVFNSSVTNGSGGRSQLVGMQRQDSNNSGSTTTSVSPRPPDTPTPMPPNANGKQSDTSTSLNTSSLTSRLRSAIGDRLTPSARHGRSASEVVSSPIAPRAAASLSRATGASAASQPRTSLSSASGREAGTVAEEGSRAYGTTSSNSSSIGRRAGASAISTLSSSRADTSPTSPRIVAPLSPRRSRPALPALTKNT